MRVLKDKVISFSNCERELSVESYIDEDFIMYMLSEYNVYSDDSNVSMNEVIERGIKEVSEYLNVNEDEEYVNEYVVKFRELLKDKNVMRVVIWSVEYDISVSVFVC